MYCCTIHVFEPVREFAQGMRRRFAKNRKIHVHNFGLSDHTGKAVISCERDASSLFRRGQISQEVHIVSLRDFLSKTNIRRINLMKINIEGAEYDLLDHLIDTGLATRVDNVQVQFHSFVPNAEQRMRRIQARLAKTHYLTYQYLFVWENWRRKAMRDLTD